MDKRSNRGRPAILPKSPLVYEKYKPGCAFGLMGLFDFRQARSSRKLVQDKPDDCRQHPGNAYTKTQLDLLSRFYEKCQRVDDVVCQKDSAPIAKVQSLESESKPSNELPDRGRITGEYSEGHCDRSVDDHPTASAFHHKEPQKQAFDDQLPGEFRTRKVKKSIPGLSDQTKEIKVQLRINEAFMDQRPKDGKGQGRGAKKDQSKYFLDALDILSSNKELFIKLLQDPNSLSIKRIREDPLGKLSFDMKLLEARMKEAGKVEENDQDAGKIVVLKPGSASRDVGKGDSTKTKVNFSLKCIKKRLKHVIGANLDPHMYKQSEKGDRSNFPGGSNLDISFRSPKDARTWNRMSSGGCFEVPDTSPGLNTRKGFRRTSELRVEPRSDALDRLNNQNYLFSRRALMERVERVDVSPVRRHNFAFGARADYDVECFHVTTQMRYSPYNYYTRSDAMSHDQAVQGKQKGSLSTLTESIEAIRQKLDKKSERPGETQSISKNLCVSTRSMNVVGTNEKEVSSRSTANSTRTSHSDACSSSSLGSHETEDLTSRILVLDQVNPKEVSSQENTSEPTAEGRVQAPGINLDNRCSSSSSRVSSLDVQARNRDRDLGIESIPEFVKFLMKAYRLNWHALVTRCHVSDQALNPSLFDEITSFPDQSHRLLFDYTNEVLREVYEQHVRFTEPKASRYAHRHNLVLEVLKRFDMDLIWGQRAKNPYQLTEIDLTRSSFCTDTEELVTEIAGAVLEELQLEIAADMKY